MKEDDIMDEFLNLAIWVLMAFLMVNAGIMWFQGSDTFIDNGLNGVGAVNQNIVNVENTDSLQGTTDCSTVSSDILQYAPCVLGQTYNLITSVVGWLWNLLTAWTSVLFLITNGLGSIGLLVQVILFPFFALVEVFAILVLFLKFAGIVRGGS